MDAAVSGKKKIQWAQAHMPVLNRLKAQYASTQPFAGLRVGICLHLEAKTAYLARVLSDLGGEVAIAGSNPLSTQDDVAEALSQMGISVHSHYGATSKEYHDYLEAVAETRPHLIIDDGGDLVSLLHRRSDAWLDDIIGGAEETTTGLCRLRAMEAAEALRFPMVAVNDALSKYLFDNRYGTGQSVWDGIVRATNLVIAGKEVVVAGYGWCGKGVALRAKGLGARVTVTEIDPIMANEALMDGCRVSTMDEAATFGDIFVTVTGCRDVITRRHFDRMKDGAILANAGHFDIEVAVDQLEASAAKVSEVRKDIKAYEWPNGRRLYLLAEGRLVNLASADGHPAEIMDMSFSLQLLALGHLLENRDLKPAVYRVTDAIDQQVASLRLESLGVNIDALTEAQQEYLSSWE